MTSQAKHPWAPRPHLVLAAVLLAAIGAPAVAQTHHDNPFAGARMYVNPEFTAQADATAGATADPTLAASMRAVGRQPTAIWIERIAAVPSMTTHLDRALAAGDDLVLFVIRDLPGRDCSALVSYAELPIDGGLTRYKTEFIDPIVSIVRDPRYAGIRIVFVVEPDTLSHLVTDLADAECAQVYSSGTFVQGIQYAVNELRASPNVYLYLDLANSAWLGFTSNSGPMVSLFGTLAAGFTEGKSALDGFATNVGQYIPVREPWLTAKQVVAGKEVFTHKFYEYNPMIDEGSFVADMYTRLTAAGWPATIGMIVDTSRNGWGGADRPRGPSAEVLDSERFVNESRVDRRAHRLLWCNVAGAGIGELPRATPPTLAATYLDAFVWAKTPGESDGASSPAPEGPPFDRFCDPEYMTPLGFATGALPDAPARGRWFPAFFTQLVRNRYPVDAPVPDHVPLTVAATASAGLVTSTPEGIDCGTVCTASYPAGTEVTLTATALTSSAPFQGWTGACAGITTPTCVVTMVEAKTVGASFGELHALTVVTAGPGAGAVSSRVGEISCGTSCSATYLSPTTVTLTASPETGSSFAGWGGACAAAGARPTCTVYVNGSQQVTATFQTGVWHSLSVTLDESGICNPPPGCKPGDICAAVCSRGNSVSSIPAGISCGTGTYACTAAFASGTSVTLVATPAPYTMNLFAGWSGACTGTARSCVVPMTQAQAVTARFVGDVNYALRVSKSGTGAGTVTGAGGAIHCGTTCSALFTGGTTVSLTATAAGGSTFGGWSGACTGFTSTCTVAMSAARDVTAIFTSGLPRLTVVKTGTGSGTVTSSPAGVSCGSTCAATYAYGTTVTLTATAAPGSRFAGWSGCTDGGTCTGPVEMTKHRTVTVVFEADPATAPCAEAITFSWNTGNFGTTGPVCYRTSQAVRGWGCSNFAGRTLRLNASTSASACGAGPSPLPKHTDGYTYFSVTAGQYPWASIYVW